MRRRSWRGVLVVVVVLGLVAAAGCHQNESLPVEAGRLRDFIDTTAAAVFPGLTPEPRPDGTGRKDCGRGKQDEDYTILVRTEPGNVASAVQQVREYWAAQGFVVSQGGGKVLTLHLESRAFDAGVTANHTGAVYLGGSTRCVPIKPE